MSSDASGFFRGQTNQALGQDDLTYNGLKAEVLMHGVKEQWRIRAQTGMPAKAETGPWILMIRSMERARLIGGIMKSNGAGSSDDLRLGSNVA